MNEQEYFWKSETGDLYRERNSAFDYDLMVKAWEKMLHAIPENSISSILELGCNIGRNLIALQRVFPDARVSLVEINTRSYEVAKKNVNPEHSFNGSILESHFEDASFDLTFTSGVLIHIAPYDLYKNMEKIYAYSKKYILFCEYFSRSLDMKIYQGQANKLFKMDYGRYFLQNFKVKVIDYGFLWGHVYDAAGFDDMTWWLFEKP